MVVFEDDDTIVDNVMHMVMVPVSHRKGFEVQIGESELVVLAVFVAELVVGKPQQQVSMLVEDSFSTSLVSWHLCYY